MSSVIEERDTVSKMKELKLEDMNEREREILKKGDYKQGDNLVERKRNRGK